MTQKINKFVPSLAKSELILFLGNQYLKYHEANFTSKLIKENNNNVIAMKIEKESNFVDMAYIPPRSNNSSAKQMFVIITDSNSIFIYEGDTLVHKLMNQFDEESLKYDDGKFDSILSDSLEIGEESDRENIERTDDHLRIQSKGTFNNNGLLDKGDRQRESGVNITKF